MEFIIKSQNMLKEMFPDYKESNGMFTSGWTNNLDYLNTEKSQRKEWVDNHYKQLKDFIKESFDLDLKKIITAKKIIDGEVTGIQLDMMNLETPIDVWYC